MIRIPWDASALAKRYIPEPGSQTVNAVLVAIPPAQMVTTIMSYSETVAALVRKLNQGVLDIATFNAAQDGLRNEVIDDPDFLVLGLEFDDILDGIELVKRHNLNSTDEAILQALLRHAGSLRPLGVSVLAASDQRLLRAAKSEGLDVLNPETVNAADIPAFLAALLSVGQRGSKTGISLGTAVTVAQLTPDQFIDFNFVNRRGDTDQPR